MYPNHKNVKCFEVLKLPEGDKKLCEIRYGKIVPIAEVDGISKWALLYNKVIENIFEYDEIEWYPYNPWKAE